MASDSTMRSNEHRTTETTSTSYFRWIGEQVTKLAIAFEEPLSKPRLTLYVEDLQEFDADRLREVFLRARRELEKFPSIAQLRALAGEGTAKQRDLLTAEAAWETAMQFLREWGVERLPERRGGKWIEPPKLEERIEAALARIGGLRGLNQVTEERRAFMFRDFAEAFHAHGAVEEQSALPPGEAIRKALGKDMGHGA